MALIIRKALFTKLANRPEWLEFRRTFHTLSGLEVELVEEAKDGEFHLLSAGIDVRGVPVGVLAANGTVSGDAQRRACQQLLWMAAEHFAMILATGHVDDHKDLPAVVLRTCRWIRSRALADEVRLAEAAAACGLSTGYLSRVFHRSTGLTFQEYVRRYRLEKACELLTSTDHSITQIAFDSGFQSISQFHRSFRAVYRESPTAYRRKYGK